MHNLHLFVTKATSPEEACSDVEFDIAEWGNENNWRTICGCVSEDNEVYQKEDGRYPPGKDETIDSINKMITGWMLPKVLFQCDGEAEKKMRKHLSGKTLTTMEWWDIQSYADHMSSIKHTEEYDMKGNSFNVLKHEFKFWKLDNCGVTHGDFTVEDKSNEKLYVVFIDMHN